MYDILCAMLPAQFEEVLFRAGAPKPQMAPASEPLARRALDLIQWADQQSGQMDAVRMALRKVVPPML